MQPRVSLCWSLLVKHLFCSEQSSAQAGKGDGAARVGDGEERREERAAGIAGEIKKTTEPKDCFRPLV